MLTHTDPSCAAIAGATVEVKNTAKRFVRNITTNAQASYTASELIVLGVL